MRAGGWSSPAAAPRTPARGPLASAGQSRVPVHAPARSPRAVAGSVGPAGQAVGADAARQPPRTTRKTPDCLGWTAAQTSTTRQGAVSRKCRKRIGWLSWQAVQGGRNSLAAAPPNCGKREPVGSAGYLRRRRRLLATVPRTAAKEPVARRVCCAGGVTH